MEFSASHDFVRDVFTPTRDYQVMNGALQNSGQQFEYSGDEPLDTITAARNGSATAFADIVRLHQRTVRAFIVRYTGNPDVADEVAQDVFLAAFRNLNSWQGHGKLISWLLAIARNHALTWLRQTRRETVSLDAVLHELHAEQLQTMDLNTTAEEIRIEALRDCIQSLQPQQRRILIQHYYESRAAADLAEEYGRTAGNLRMLLLRLRRTLRSCIESKTGEQC